VSGVILEGTTPLNKDVKKWYYFQFPFGSGVLAGGLTLMLVILPIIIVSSQEAIRAVSQEMRSGVLALGGTKWQSIEKVVLPSAIPGICTGSILALSRAIGEAAPILLIGYVGLQVGPDHLMAAFAALPLEIYNWTSEPDAAFRVAAAAGIIVLLAVLFSFNAIAVFIRYKAQKANS
jgi:phosphate transport system permease protein